MTRFPSLRQLVVHSTLLLLLLIVAFAVNSPLPVDGELLILQVQLDEGLPRVEAIAALKCPRIDSRVGGRLDVAGLQSTVTELALAIRSANNNDIAIKSWAMQYATGTGF